MPLEKKFPCNACKARTGEDVFLVQKYDMLVCPKCQTSIVLKEESPLGRYQETWNRNAEELFPLLRPPLYQDDLANPRLHLLYEDCYHTLLIGRYNASIVNMGVLLEAVMKERILLKTDLDYPHPYGSCLKKIQDERLMEPKDIGFLKQFKDNIRNVYQHSDESRILETQPFVPVYVMEFKGKLSLEKLNRFLEDARSGKLEPVLLPANFPLIRSIIKSEYDRKLAVDLFNQVL